MPASAAAAKQRSNTVVGRPWQPGQSGNPKGRKRNPDSITVALRAKVYGNLPEFVDALYNVAVKDKNVVAMKEIMERLEGKALDVDMPSTLRALFAAQGVEATDDMVADAQQRLVHLVK